MIVTSSSLGGGGLPLALASAMRTPSEPPLRRPASSTLLARSPGGARPAVERASSSCRLREAMLCSVRMPRKRSRAKAKRPSPPIPSKAWYACSTARWSD